MNSLEIFNKTIQYIEDNLDGCIKESQIAIISTYSIAMFGRIFSVLSGFSLGEYIRLRKLSKAANDLRDSDEKVIDIAIKYGYESVDAFSAAFKKFHNETPTSVRKGSDFKVFPPIHFTLSIEGGKNMNIRIEKKKAFKITGISINKANPNTNFSKVWEDLFNKVEEQTLKSLGNGQSYGTCFEYDGSSFGYMAAYDLINKEKATDLGLEIMDIPEAEYAIVELNGAIPGCIHDGWKYIVGTFFPQQGYRHSASPDFEVYSQGDMYDKNYKMELWVPIERE
ncbi:AraC family transcriptional regulator [Clostridium cadaveris]|uniref:AraC family transcriptional regulator n=1 Tax=Clostridium cadaveris TaxID=1529 RepID=A0A1I2JWS2_9CLOT|nr:AraC family transcriptional regulator [Clostridium cadaveris]SFF57271.1 AraC family transcriptional regulator [Clostridium cadaveris]